MNECAAIIKGCKISGQKDDLYDIAIEAYRQAYQILEGGSQQTYPLRGIARICLLQNKKDSALLYYQKALDYALAEQDSSLIGALYHDLAMVYNEKKIMFKPINMYRKQ